MRMGLPGCTGRARCQPPPCAVPRNADAPLARLSLAILRFLAAASSAVARSGNRWLSLYWNCLASSPRRARSANVKSSEWPPLPPKPGVTGDWSSTRWASLASGPSLRWCASTCFNTCAAVTATLWSSASRLVLRRGAGFDRTCAPDSPLSGPSATFLSLPRRNAMAGAHARSGSIECAARRCVQAGGVAAGRVVDAESVHHGSGAYARVRHAQVVTSSWETHDSVTWACCRRLPEPSLAKECSYACQRGNRWVGWPCRCAAFQLARES